MEDLEAKSSLEQKDESTYYRRHKGGEGREDSFDKPFPDVWNRSVRDLWRSDVVILQV